MNKKQNNSEKEIKHSFFCVFLSLFFGGSFFYAILANIEGKSFFFDLPIKSSYIVIWILFCIVVLFVFTYFFHKNNKIIISDDNFMGRNFISGFEMIFYWHKITKISIINLIIAKIILIKTDSRYSYLVLFTLNNKVVKEEIKNKWKKIVETNTKL